jgi:hypothetical protein
MNEGTDNFMQKDQSAPIVVLLGDEINQSQDQDTSRVSRTSLPRASRELSNSENVFRKFKYKIKNKTGYE